MFNDGWTAKDKRNALVHLKVLESFEFVYALITLQFSLLHLREAAVKLQNKNQNIMSSYSLIAQSCADLKMQRANVDDCAHLIFQHACRIAACSKITVAMPSLSHQQWHCSNPTTSSAQDYFKFSVSIPFLDHLIQDLSYRFDAHSKQAASLQDLLTTKVTPTSSLMDIQHAVAFYENEVPNVHIMDEKFLIWKNKWLSISQQEPPWTITQSLHQCS